MLLFLLGTSVEVVDWSIIPKTMHLECVVHLFDGHSDFLGKLNSCYCVNYILIYLVKYIMILCKLHSDFLGKLHHSVV